MEPALKIRYSVLFLILLFAPPLAIAESTFFDQDDAFVMGGSETGGVIGEATGGTTSGGGCTYKWNCTNWSICFPSRKQIRSCTNIGTCSDTYKSPETEQNCTYTSPEPKKENKGLEKENVTEKDGEETKKQNETEKEIDKNKIIIYSIIIFIIISVIFYLKKDYFKN